MDLSRWVSRILARTRALFRSHALDRELDEELRFHLDHLIAANVSRGLSPEAARREALLAMGGIEQRKEECRDTRGVRLILDFLQDVRYAITTLRRGAAFTTTSVLTLTLGIGATVAMFTVVNGVLLRPLPFPEPDRLFLVALSPRSFFIQQPGMADATYLAFRERDHPFAHLAAFSSYKGNLVGAGEPVVIKVGSVTTEFFDAMGVRPAMGRTFVPGDGNGGERAVVLSDALWRSRFASDAATVGKLVTLNGTSHSVVGVMPSGFDFPGGMAAWTPNVIKVYPGNSMIVTVLGRLKPGMTRDQAHAAFETVVPSLPDGPREDRSNWDVGLLPLKELLIGDVRRPLRLFAGAVLVVLLIACANVANLLLARASVRDREMALRTALGAGRNRLVRQLLAESLLLSAVGAMLGVLFAYWALPALLALAPAGRIPRSEAVRFDIASVVFAAVVATLTGVAFGLGPAVRLTKSALSHSQVPRTRSSPGHHERFRAALVVSEIALALVLFAAAGLMMKSFLRLRAVDPGFRTDNVVRLSIELPMSKYSTVEGMHAFHEDMLARLSHLPDVVAAGVVNWMPFGERHLNGDFREEGASQDAPFNVDKTAVSAGYFRAMSIRLLRGREFTEHDSGATLPVAIVSRTVANAIGGPDAAVGKRVTLWRRANVPEWLTVVGVVEDVKQLGPAEASHAAVYQPFLQVRRSHALGDMTYVVRTASDPLASIPAIRQVLRSVDKDQPAVSIGAMRDVLDGATAEPAFYARLLSVFALLAVTLAIVGTYGVIAYSVAQRTHEIGVRMALGARSGAVIWMVLRRTVFLAAAGAMIGATAAGALTRYLKSFLFEITPTDPATFTAVTLIIFAVAILAGVIPARRATRVDPLIALRHE